MKKMLKRGVLLIIAIVCLSIAAAVAGAQATYTPPSSPGYTPPPSSMPSKPEGRAGTWEFFLPLTYQPSSHWEGPGGSSLNLDTTWGIGFGGGYNFNEHFQLNALFSWAARDYTANVLNSDLTRRQYSNTLDSSTFALNGILYLTKGKISPFLSAGAGVTYLDTNIQNGPGTTVCWWDPWYGYVCGSSAPTKTETDFTYNAGAGIRFDFGHDFSLQPSYNKWWIDIGNASTTPSFDIWRLDFIIKLP